MSHWVILLGMLAKCQNISESDPGSNQVKLESAKLAPDNVPLLCPLIGTIVALYSIDALPIYLTYICVVGRCHMPCYRVVMGVRPGVTKRHNRICKGVEREMGCSLGSGVHVGWVEGWILKGVRQS